MTAPYHPVKIYFELTRYCNFHCDFCPIRVSHRENQHMDFALYQRGIDDIAAHRLTPTVGFHVLGEPMLSPHLYEAIVYARSRGLSTEMSTNGSMLTPANTRRLIEAGLDSLAISVQVLDEDEHRSRGSSLTFAEYYQRILAALRQIRRAGSPMQLTLCFMNKASLRLFELDHPMRLADERRADRQKLTRYILDIAAAIDQPLEAKAVEAALRRMNLTLPRTLNIGEQTRVYVQPFADWGNAFNRRTVRPARYGSCNYALNNLGVLADGSITLCCADYDGHTALGNLNNTLLSEVLSSAQVWQVKRGFEQGRVLHPHCQHCLGASSPARVWLKSLVSLYLFRVSKFQPARVREMKLA